MIYDVIRNRRDQSGSHDEVVVRGLPLKEAREKAVELQHEYSKANPGKSSWTCDLFSIQLDTKLLEASPKLLTALEEICREAESWHTVHDHGSSSVQCDSICALIPKMRAAISEARGVA
jgi:hypothetical protein